MNRETKVGVIIGLAFILAFAYVISRKANQPVYFLTSGDLVTP